MGLFKRETGRATAEKTGSSSQPEMASSPVESRSDNHASGAGSVETQFYDCRNVKNEKGTLERHPVCYHREHPSGLCLFESLLVYSTAVILGVISRWPNLKNAFQSRFEHLTTRMNKRLFTYARDLDFLVQSFLSTALQFLPQNLKSIKTLKLSQFNFSDSVHRCRSSLSNSLMEFCAVIYSYGLSVLNEHSAAIYTVSSIASEYFSDLKKTAQEKVKTVKKSAGSVAETTAATLEVSVLNLQAAASFVMDALMSPKETIIMPSLSAANSFVDNRMPQWTRDTVARVKVLSGHGIPTDLKSLYEWLSLFVPSTAKESSGSSKQGTAYGQLTAATKALMESGVSVHTAMIVGDILCPASVRRAAVSVETLLTAAKEKIETTLFRISCTRRRSGTPSPSRVSGATVENVSDEMSINDMKSINEEDDVPTPVHGDNRLRLDVLVNSKDVPPHEFSDAVSAQ